MKVFPVLRQLNAASLVTSASVLFGMGACQLALSGRLGGAMLCGALALPCDMLDGWVARRLGQVTPFGSALDSLADAISFCVAPSVLAQAMGAGGGWGVALCAYPLAGLWRLARFQQVGTATVNGRECFEGCPTSIGAAGLYVVAAMAAGLALPVRAWVLGGYLIAAAAAMCSSFPVPKRGLHTRILWVLVPVAVVASWVRQW